jgi:hypothetical protein
MYQKEIISRNKFFFFDKSVKFIKMRERGATLSTQGVYKRARGGGGRREKESQKN